MRFFLLLLLVACSTSSSRPHIYDCFLFFNELELLRIRFEELYPYVNHFVLVEAKETFRGTPKPLYFEENKERFAPFKDKIIHKVIEEHYETDNPWERERFQRSQVLSSLSQCHPHDIILLSDLDEIPRGSLIPHIVDLIDCQHQQAVVLQQRMYYGYLNRYESLWTGTVATNYQTAQRINIKSMRRLRNLKPRHLRKLKIHKISLLENGGWHFTSMGGAEQFAYKMRSYSHTEHATPDRLIPSYHAQAIEARKKVAVDDTFPLYIQTHEQLLRSQGFVD